MKKLILTACLTLTMTAAFAANNLPTPRPTSTKLNLPSFSAIHVTGRVEVLINGTRSKNRGDTFFKINHPQQIAARIRHHILYLRALSNASPNAKPPIVNVHLYRLNKLDVFGQASIVGNHIRSNGLYLHADTTGNITLNGKLLVERIRNYGPSRIHLRWVTGKKIRIRSDAGRMIIAGSAGQVRIKLRNHAKLDAQYLRAKHVLVQTRDFSVASVLPVISLRAFATDFSHVYFYKTPEYISRYTNRSGNVLQLGRRN